MNNSEQKQNKRQNKIVRVNYNIRNEYCRVIEEGGSPRIMKTSEAIKYAESKGLDLVEIGYDPANKCSNAKVIDYGKFCYENKRKEKLAKKQARENTPEVKSIQFSLTTDIADMERQINHAKQFLADGDKVKLSIRFRNRREGTNTDYTNGLMNDILSRFDGIGVLESKPSVNGREYSCILRKA